MFVHYEALRILKDHHKWRSTKSVVPGRRVRMIDGIKELNELFWDDTIPRPPGQGLPRVKNWTLQNRCDLHQVEKLSRKWSKKSCYKNVQKKMIISQLKRNSRNWSFFILAPSGPWGRKMRLTSKKSKMRSEQNILA